MKFVFGAVLMRLLQLGLVATISFAPLIFEKIIVPYMGWNIPPSTSPATNPYYLAAFLFVLQIAKFSLDNLKAGRADEEERLRNLQDLAVALDLTVGVIERQITTFASEPARQIEISAFLQHALKCIEATIKLCTGSLDDRYCCVTLMTFEPGDRMQVRSRSRVGRAVGRYFPNSEVIACLAGKYAIDLGVIHNFRMASFFRKANPVKYRSLTSLGKPKYESILFLPLPAVIVPGGNQIRKGVVTVDAARPYEFLGKELDILIRVQAYLHLINVLLTNHSVGIEPELT